MSVSVLLLGLAGVAVGLFCLAGSALKCRKEVEAGNITLPRFERSVNRRELLKDTELMLMGSGADVYHIPWKSLKLEPRPFARGGGGEIFKGKYMGHVIAAKHNFNSAATSASDQEAFDREVLMLTKLTHPCVLSLYGVSTDPKTITDPRDNGMYMIMEYCGGGDLAGFYKEPTFGPRDYVRVVSELLSGILYLHQRDVAHRDLKPENVLLATGTRQVKVADFGLAKTNRNTFTRGVGTPAYMPPEMFAEEEDANKTNMLAVDVYALGIMIWQLWFKEVPFGGKSVASILVLIGRGKRPAFWAKGGVGGAHRCPEPLQRLAERCWAQEVTDRPPMEEVCRAFEEEAVPAIDPMHSGSSSSGGGGAAPPEVNAVERGPTLTAAKAPVFSLMKQNQAAVRGAQQDDKKAKFLEASVAEAEAARLAAAGGAADEARTLHVNPMLLVSTQPHQRLI